MADDASRPHWRDVGLLAALTVVLLVGLVYYGVRLADEPEPTTGPAPTAPSTTVTETPSPVASSPTPTPTPTPEPTPEPTEPTAVPTGPPARCWDDRTVPSLAECGLPTGDAGLAWVYPSFGPDRAGCAPTPQTDRAYTVVTSWSCVAQAAGQQVTVVYDEVADPAEIAAWIAEKFAPGEITDLPGAYGGRRVVEDVGGRPARITGTYARFPYVVSVFAPTEEAARAAWTTIVRQRPPRAIKGVPA